MFIDERCFQTTAPFRSEMFRSERSFRNKSRRPGYKHLAPNGALMTKAFDERFDVKKIDRDRLLLWIQWKANREGRAFAWRRTYLDAAAMHASDTPHGWQPEASPGLSRREKWIEDASEILFADAAAIV